MSKIYAIFICFSVFLYSITGLAFTAPPPPTNGYVVDLAGKMSASQVSELNQKISQIKDSTKNEFGVLLLPDMSGSNIEDVAYVTFNSWGIGQKGLDNGILIVVSIKERKSRIETGKGIGGELTDLQANDILKNNLAPRLKAGDFAGGFSDTITAVSSLLTNRKSKSQPASTTPSVAKNAQKSDDASIFAAVIALLVGMVSAFSFFLFRSERNRQNKIKLEAELAEISFERELARNIELVRKAADERVKLVNMKNISFKLEDIQSSQQKLAAKPKTTTTTYTKPQSSVIKSEPDDRARRDIEAWRESEARRKREVEAMRQRELDDARRRREEDDRRRRDESSSWSSSSGYSSSSYSDSSSSSYGGGDSGGGGSSGDW